MFITYSVCKALLGLYLTTTIHFLPSNCHTFKRNTAAPLASIKVLKFFHFFFHVPVFCTNRSGSMILSVQNTSVLNTKVIRNLVLGLMSRRERKSAAVFILPGTLAILTEIVVQNHRRSFQREGGIILVWKNMVTNLLSVKEIVGLEEPHNIWLYSMKRNLITRNFFSIN